MKETKQDEHLVFYPSKGLGNILFSFDENNILETLGEADEIDEDNVSESESVVSISYYDKGLDFFIEYFNEHSILSIHSDDIILDGVNIASLEQDEMLQFVRQYHEKNNIVFEHEKMIDNETDEICYFFDNIGMTIWYEDQLTDICVQHPDNM